MQLLEQIQTAPAPTPADEIQHVQDYQNGWNDAQTDKPHRIEATIYYSMGFVDGSYCKRALQ